MLSGADLNGDGALSEDEVSQRTTLCREQLLTRYSTIAAGSDCPATGVRIETGRDRNEDGLLDDAEVEATSVECSRVYVGNLTVTSQAQADALVDVALVDGNLTIAPTEDAAISLPNLRAVLGFVSITGTAVGSVDLSSLAEVSSGFDIRDTALLTSVSIPGLSLVGQRVSVTNNTALKSLDLRGFRSVQALWIQSNAALGGIQFPFAFRAPMGVAITDNLALGTLSLDLDGDLAAVTIRNNPKLFSLRFHAPLSWVTSAFAFENCATLERAVIQIQTIRPSATLKDFPRLLELEFVQTRFLGSLTIANAPRLRLLHLTQVRDIAGSLRVEAPVESISWGGNWTPYWITVGGDFALVGTQLVDFLAPMGPIGGAIEISGNPLLTTVGGNFGGVSSVHALTVSGNPQLASIGFGALASVREGLTISGNDVLQTLSMPLVDEAQTVTVTDNPQLAACRVDGFFAQFPATTTTVQSGNDTTATCP